MIKQLEGEVKKAHVDVLAKQAIWELERSKEYKLEKQIAHCTLKSPIDGCVQYADADNRGTAVAIQEGATVRERQKIASILDFDGPLQITIKVPEAAIAHVVPNMKARVKVDAFPNEILDGVVTEVAPLPDPAHGGLVRSAYTTRIRIGGGHPNLRPGMTAEAEIIVADRDDAIGVPAGAVVRYDGKDHVAVKTPDGRVEWRDVVLGGSDGSTVEIKQGLRPGDQLILDPRPLLTDEQRARMKMPTEPAPKKATTSRKGLAKPARPPR